MNWSDNERRRARDDARVANFPHEVHRIAHLLLTNRALAAALLHMDANAHRYAEIGNFLDQHARSLVEQAIAMRIPEAPSYPERESEEDLPREDQPVPWDGDAQAVCVGKTQKGNTCTRRAKHSHRGLPYCTSHYPFSAGHLAFQEREAACSEAYQAAYDAYCNEREALLAHIAETEQLARGLEEMNARLTSALQRLEIRTPSVTEPISHTSSRDLIRVDGLNFELETAQYPQSFWILGSDGDRLAVCAQQGDKGWAVFQLDPNTGGLRNTNDRFLARSREDAVRYAALYTMCYRIRRRRDLSWFTGEIVGLVQQGAGITSPEPLQVLCGITISRPGWHVMQRTCGEHHQNFVSCYSGNSETEARWKYAAAERENEIAAVLISPSNQVIEHRINRQSFW